MTTMTTPVCLACVLYEQNNRPSTFAAVRAETKTGLVTSHQSEPPQRIAPPDCRTGCDVDMFAAKFRIR